MKISVFGLGYVGCVSAACFSELGHDILGVDINPKKVSMINDANTPIFEKHVEQIIKTQVRAGRLKATHNVKKAVQHSDVIFICVGTPSNGNGSIDTKHVERVCVDIGKALKNTDRYITIALRSTVLPGIIESIVFPSLEKYSSKKIGTDFGFAYNPEFLREGSSVHDFYHPPRTVIGEVDKRSADVLEVIYGAIDAPTFRMQVGEATLIKYADNSFHALKVAFANEIGRLCKSLNIDSRNVMDVFCKDEKLNLSSYYLKPGFAFGGSCLPKDLRAIVHQARQRDLTIPLLNAALDSNQEHIQHAMNMIMKDGRKKIGVLGLSFKSGTDDLRESPMVTLVEQLIGKGYEVQIFDKNVTIARLMGANKDYVNREIPHLAKLMCSNIEDVLDNTEVIIIGTKEPESESILEKVSKRHTIFDFTGLDSTNNGYLKEVNYEGICW